MDTITGAAVTPLNNSNNSACSIYFGDGKHLGHHVLFILSRNVLMYFKFELVHLLLPVYVNVLMHFALQPIK